MKNTDKIESWVYQIARTTIIDHYCSKKEFIELKDDPIATTDESKKNPHTKIQEGLMTFIDKLPDIYKEAILLTEYQGMTQKQLSQKFGISLTGAKSRVQRGRKMLKDFLLQCCHFDYDKYGTIIDYYKRCCCCSNQPKK